MDGDSDEVPTLTERIAAARRRREERERAARIERDAEAARRATSGVWIDANTFLDLTGLERTCAPRSRRRRR